MHCDQNLRAAIQEVLAPNGVWELQGNMASRFTRSIARLPQGDVSEEERRYPTTKMGLRAFMDGFFARHYFQVQDSLLDFFASPAFSAILRHGIMHVADVGCGPSVASLAILSMASVSAHVMNGGRRASGPLTVHVVLDDTSDVCLDEGRSLLDRYGHFGTNPVRVGRVLPLSSPFPRSLVPLRRIANMTTPFDVCCLAYVLIPLTEQMGARVTAEGIRQLAQTGNPRDGQLLLTQDKFREDLHRDICQALCVSGETADLKQRVYDSQNQNKEQTYTYCRSCFPAAKLAVTRSPMAVV